MAGRYRGCMWSLAVILVFLIGEIHAQGDFGDYGDLAEFGLGSTPVDLVLVVDTSQFSNTSESLDKEILVKRFLTSFLESPDFVLGDIKIAMLTYSTHPKVVFDLNKYSKPADMVDSIFTAEFIPGERNTADALGIVRSQLLVRDRPEVPNVVLLLTSGKSNRNEYRTLQEAEALKYARTNMFVVGYGLDKQAEEEVNEIASKPTQENTFLMEVVDELDVVKDIVFLQIFTRAEQAYNSPAAGSEMLDVAFLIHFSNTMKKADFQRVIEFMKDTIQYSGIDDDRVRVGAAMFRKRGIVLFDFNSYLSKDEVKSGIDKINYNYRAKSASITSGLETVRTSLLVDSAGVRRNVPNLVILITDSNADTDVSGTIQAAEKLKADGTAIFAVGINVTYPEELLGLTSSPDYAIIVNDTTLLKDQEYKIQEAFVGLRTDGFPLVIPHFQTTTTTTTSTTAPTTTSSSTTVKNLEELDVIFAVHVSHNVKISDIKKKLTPFINDLILNMDVERGGVRVAFVVFGPDATVEFDFKRNKKNKKLAKAVKKVLKPKTLRSKGSDIVKALNLIQTELLLEKKGERPDVPNLMIFVTDSASSSDMTEIIKESSAMKRTGTSIFAIGVKDADMKEIEALANDPATEFSFLGKKYDDFTKSTELREKLSKLKIFEKLNLPTDGKVPKSTKSPTTKKPPKTTQKIDPTTKVEKVPKGNESVTTVKTTRKPTKKPTTIPPTSSTTYIPVASTTPFSIPLSEASQADIVFAFHLSPKASPFDFGSVQEFLKELIDSAKEGIENNDVQIGLMIYAADPEVIFHINRYQDIESMKKEIDGLDQTRMRSSRNDVSGALALGRQMLGDYFGGRKGGIPSALIIVTDENSNENVDLIMESKKKVDAEGIRIFTIGVNMTNKEELETLATVPENVMMVKRYGQLQAAASDLQRSILALAKKEEKDTTTVPPTTIPTTTITTTEKQISTTERIIELPPIFTGCGLSKTDLIFILDASTSVTEENFQKMRDFLKDFLKNADINSGSVRVGINIYSTEVQIMFHLNEYQREADVMAAIDKIPYIYGSTNTADALRTMNTQMFTTARGDRPDAPNVCVLLTDGVSNINSRRTMPEAEAARDAGIQIFVIGIGLKDTKEVEGIASPPISQNLFNVQDFDELVGLKQRMFSASCEEPSDDPPVANAGRDLIIELPDDTVMLSGEKSTDDNGIVEYVWSQLSGPRVSVAPSDNQYLELTDLKEGEYVIELKVVDAEGQSDTDTVSITVLPEPDLPPRANAGDDQTIQLPTDNVVLDGRRSSDDKGIVEYDWELTSPRDRSVILRGDDSQRLTADNLKEGTYVFTLTVKDRKGQSDSDSARIVVLPAPDEPPVANAGRDYEIQLPADSVTLDGSRSTDDIGITSYRWTLVSGDSRGVRMSGERTDTLSLDNLKAGEYVARLAVSDRSRQTSSDEARIIVKPAPERTSGYDVIFILDSSVSPSYFAWMNNYARNVIREMSIDDGEFRVGYLTYSHGAYRQFDLNDNDNKADVLAAIDRVDYKPGSKNTASAFKYVRSRMFTPQNGDRDYAKNYIVHLTGGGPSNNAFDSATEACTLQNNNVGMFAVGFGEVPDRSELDAHSSLPTSDYEMVIRAESEMGEMPGLMLYQLKNGSPRPSPCPTEAPTTPPPPGVCSANGDIVFILDSSGSVGQDNFYRVLNFTYATIEGLDIDNGRFRVGVTTFSDTSRLDFNLDEFDNKADMEAALKQVVYMYGNTHTAHALRRARLEMFTMATGDRPDIPNVVVIITDGQSNVNHELTIPEARALKAAGVTIITVAVGFTSETSELIGLTSPPVSENLIYVQNYESLDQLKNQLISPLCTDSNLCRKKPCQNGGVCMDGIRSFVCLCPDEFFGDTCSKQCGEPADVVIVLDSSNTVGEYNFGRLKEYAEHLVREMNKDSCDVNIGFLKYSSSAMVQVNLGMYGDTETNVRALDQISYTRGRANMAAAFRALRTQMFNGQNGDRSGARNIAYFLTDGTNDVNADKAESEAELTISSGVRIIPIGINLRERFELDNIANNQGINVIEISDESNLLENTESILRPMFEGNDFCAENPCSNGGKCMNEPFGFTCDCPIGYTGETCQKRCTAKGDVVFAVDTSRYVTRSELKKVRRFLRSVVKRMRFKRNEFSVGMVQFTDWAKVTLDFNEGRSKKAVRSSIAGLRVHGGDPEPATALAKANYRIFSSNGADREKPDYLILVTKSMRGEEEILKEANKLKLRGTRVLGVGLGLTDKEREYMESAVSMPFRETAMFATDAKELADIADRVVEYMCDDEDMCRENPCRNGGSCRSLGGNFYCECGVGYAGKFCENRCEARADIVFLLDSSGSVGHIDFRRVKQFVHNMVSDLQIGKDKTRVGLVTYSSTSRHGFFMSKYYSLFELQNAIAGISYEYGDTNTAAGLRLVRERYFGGTNGDRRDIQNFLVIVTDGVSNINPDETITEANLLKEEGVHIYAVGIGNFDPYEINSIASAPASQNAFILSDYRALGNISSSIVKKTCRDPTVCEENPCRNGGLCVPGINGPFCECRVGYRGENCQESCVTVKDIYFLMDSSDSVGAKNYQTALNFIASIAEEFSGEGSYNRFSLITFSDEVQIVFSLGRYTRLPILMNAIKFARYRPGKTNTAGAFRTVGEISVDALGDRNDAENIIFLITDGNGNVDEETTVDAAEYLKDQGARIIPIAVNMNDYSEIEQIASNRKDIFKVSSFNDLESILEDIVVTTCRNGNEITTNG